MMQTRRLNFEHLLWLLIWALALGIRLLNLGREPLSDYEAGWAIQSWEAAQGGSPVFGSNPGYIFPTTALFFSMESNNFLARFWPALAGSLVVLALYGFRRMLGREAALIAALGLALDPGMVAISRLAGGPMMALGFGLLALAFWVNRWFVGLGIFAALALISGSSVWLGLVGLGISWGVSRWMGITSGGGFLSESETLEDPVQPSQGSGRLGLILGGAVALIVSTLFFRFPSGLGGWAGSIAEFLRGWGTWSTIPALRLPAAVIFYQPLALVFGLVAAVRGWRNKSAITRWLSLWFLVALLLPVFYPGRQVFDVLWAILPLWGLAAVELRRYLRLTDLPLIPAAQGAVVLVLLALFWLVSLGLSTGDPAWMVLVVIPLLVALITVLVGMNWSWEAGGLGLAWGVGLALGLMVLASTFSAARLSSNRAVELWAPPPATIQADLLVDTLQDIAVLKNGREDVLEIVSLVEDPSLRWVLRDFRGVEYLPSVAMDIYPVVLITMEPFDELPQLSSYRGQDYLWYESPGWDGALPYEWFKWMSSRKAPIWPEWMVAWVRVDLFPDDGSME